MMRENSFKMLLNSELFGFYSVNSCTIHCLFIVTTVKITCNVKAFEWKEKSTKSHHMILQFP